MSERRTDFELLRDFTRHGDQLAFASVVRRHLDLVYGTAVRKVEDQGAAEEVAQNVFAALARKAWQFASDDSLPAWLHRTALLEARGWLRGELRRRRREQSAAELGTTMKTPDEQTALRALVPLLDEALLSLPRTRLARCWPSRTMNNLESGLPSSGPEIWPGRECSELNPLETSRNTPFHPIPSWSTVSATIFQPILPWFWAPSALTCFSIITIRVGAS